MPWYLVIPWCFDMSCHDTLSCSWCFDMSCHCYLVMPWYLVMFMMFWHVMLLLPCHAMIPCHAMMFCNVMSLLPCHAIVPWHAMSLPPCHDMCHVHINMIEPCTSWSTGTCLATRCRALCGESPAKLLFEWHPMNPGHGLFNLLVKPGLVNVHCTFNTRLGDSRTRPPKRVQSAVLDLCPCHWAIQPQTKSISNMFSMENTQQFMSHESWVLNMFFCKPCQTNQQSKQMPNMPNKCPNMSNKHPTCPPNKCLTCQTCSHWHAQVCQTTP